MTAANRMGDSGAGEDLYYFNGVNGATGGYLLDPLPSGIVASLAQDEKLDARELAELKARFFASTGAFLGVVAGVDPANLAEAGWGVIFPHDADPAIREALGPLLDRRRSQASARKEAYYREFLGADGYRPGDSSSEFLVRHKVAPGSPANPERMPYYLLIVGSPESVPYRFQYGLDVSFAVGRIHFDAPQDYARYAANVIAAESAPSLSRRAVCFGVKNPDDKATRMSAELLVAPLAAALAKRRPEHSIETVLGEAATKGRLSALLAGGARPDLLFTAGHGMGFPHSHPLQLAHQGALLCGNWPGPLLWRGEIPQDFYLAGDDLPETADLSGMIAMLFACYGAGTPKTDDFAQRALQSAASIAPYAFIGMLPQQMLLRGASAVVGHVERAWSFSFAWPRVGEQIDVFESALSQLMGGVPVGSAVEFFNDRYAALTTELEAEKENVRFGMVPNPVGLSGLWTAKNDARNYVIIGDPATRLPQQSTTAAP